MLKYSNISQVPGIAPGSLWFPGPQVRSLHFCLPTSDVLIQGIMDEDVLGLRKRREGHATCGNVLATSTILCA